MDKESSQSSGWISVEDKLPGEAELVLCCTKFGRMYVADYTSEHGFFDIRPQHNVTHWMPLPDTPESIP